MKQLACRAARPDLSPCLASALGLLLLLGAWFLRVHALTATPPGLEPDAAHNTIDALRISRGGLPFPLDFDTRPEPAYRFILAGWFVLVGPGIVTARLLSGLIGLLTVALAYRAGLGLLGGSAWRRLGALVAAGALAAMMPHLFLSRSIFRALLLVPVVLVTLVAALDARRTGKNRSWAVAGFMAGLGVHTYTAGIATPIWYGVFLAHQMTLPRRGERIGCRAVLFSLLGLLLPLLVWGAMLWAIPGLYSRVREASAYQAQPRGEAILSVVLARLLDAPGALAAQREAFAELRAELGAPGVAERAARLVLAVAGREWS